MNANLSLAFGTKFNRAEWRVNGIGGGTLILQARASCLEELRLAFASVEEVEHVATALDQMAMEMRGGPKPYPANAESDGEPRVTKEPAQREYKVTTDTGTMMIAAASALQAANMATRDGHVVRRVDYKAEPPCPVCHCPGDLTAEPADEHERRHGIGDIPGRGPCCDECGWKILPGGLCSAGCSLNGIPVTQCDLPPLTREQVRNFEQALATDITDTEYDLTQPTPATDITLNTADVGMDRINEMRAKLGQRPLTAEEYDALPF